MSWGQDIFDKDMPNEFVLTSSGNSSDNTFEEFDSEATNLTLDYCKYLYENRSKDFQNIHGDQFCKVTFDSIACWPPTPFNETVTISCFSRLFEVDYDSSQNATRFCFANGTWSKQNYSMCKEILISEDTSTGIYFVGYSLSLITLLIAVGIFMYFKDLRCLRNKIHINLMWSYILMYCTWIVMLVLIKYRNESIILCRFGTMLLHYSHLSTFFWTFVEGMYLYILVVMTMRRKNFKLRIYVSIGWGFPLIFIIIWGILKGVVTRTNNDYMYDECPWLETDSLDWIYLAPPLLVIFVNLAFLFSIMWVLITKLRSSPAAIEHQQHYKAARALLILMPLLGITWVIIIYVPAGATETKIFQIAQTALLSTQGLMIALFYCFLNTEVQDTIKHRYDNWKARRSFGSSSRKSNGFVISRDTEWTLINCDELEAIPSQETPPNLMDVPISSEVIAMHPNCGGTEQSKNYSPETFKIVCDKN